MKFVKVILKRNFISTLGLEVQPYLTQTFNPGIEYRISEETYMKLARYFDLIEEKLEIIVDEAKDIKITTEETKPEETEVTTEETKPEETEVTTEETKPEETEVTTEETKPEETEVTTEETKSNKRNKRNKNK